MRTHVYMLRKKTLPFFIKNKKYPLVKRWRYLLKNLFSTTLVVRCRAMGRAGIMYVKMARFDTIRIH